MAMLQLRLIVLSVKVCIQIVYVTCTICNRTNFHEYLIDCPIIVNDELLVHSYSISCWMNRLKLILVTHFS